MNWSYLVFLFPLWFGWEMSRRLKAAEARGKQARTAMFLFPITAGVSLITPVVWFYFDPPEPDVRAPLVILAAQSSLLLMLVGASIRWITSALAKKLAQRSV